MPPCRISSLSHGVSLSILTITFFPLAPFRKALVPNHTMRLLFHSDQDSLSEDKRSLFPPSLVSRKSSQKNFWKLLKPNSWGNERSHNGHAIPLRAPWKGQHPSLLLRIRVCFVLVGLLVAATFSFQSCWNFPSVLFFCANSARPQDELPQDWSELAKSGNIRLAAREQDWDELMSIPRPRSLTPGAAVGITEAIPTKKSVKEDAIIPEEDKNVEEEETEGEERTREDPVPKEDDVEKDMILAKDDAIFVVEATTVDGNLKGEYVENVEEEMVLTTGEKKGDVKEEKEVFTMGDEKANTEENSKEDAVFTKEDAMVATEEDEKSLTKEHLQGMQGARELSASTTDKEAGSPAELEDVEYLSRSELIHVLEGMQLEEPVVVCTIANSAFQDMLRNWLFHLRKVGVSNVLVAVLDAETKEICLQHGVATVSFNSPSHLRGNMFRKSEEFTDFGTLKSLFLLTLLQLGHDALMSDTDTVWLDNPRFYFSKDGPMPSADILVSSDSVSHTNDVASMAADPTKVVNKDVQGWFRNATGRAHELYGNVYEHALNTGVLMLRSRPATIAFVNEWHLAMKTKGQSQGWQRVWGDQHALNQLMRRNMFPIQVVDAEKREVRNNRVIWASGGRVKLGILPPSLFCNGHVFFVQQIPQSLGLRPLVVHNTFQFHFHWGKTMRFREHGLWAIDPDEYYTQGNFLSFNITLPQRISSMPTGIEKHSAAIRLYYIATRNALAVAVLLNRTLILPMVLCFCDRYWHALEAPCRGPGGDNDPPFVCPFDHYSNPYYWNESGYSYREHSFLINPRVPQAIRSSRKNVRVVPRGEFRQLSRVGLAESIPESATDAEIREALGPLSHVRVLHLTSANSAFCRFEDEENNLLLDYMTAPLLDEDWCCTPKGNNTRIKLTQQLSNRTQSQCQADVLDVSLR